MVARVDLQLVDLRHQRRRTGEVADAIARHAVGLREREHRERALGRERPDRDVLAAVDVVLVHLVGEQPEIVAPRQLGQRLEPRAGQHASRRVRGRREVERDAARREALLDRRRRRRRRSARGRRTAPPPARRAASARCRAPGARRARGSAPPRPGSASADDRAREAGGGAGGDEHAVALDGEAVPLAELLDQGGRERAGCPRSRSSGACPDARRPGALPCGRPRRAPSRCRRRGAERRAARSPTPAARGARTARRRGGDGPARLRGARHRRRR